MVENLKLIPEKNFIYIGVQICMLNAFKNHDKAYTNATNQIKGY